MHKQHHLKNFNDKNRHYTYSVKYSSSSAYKFKKIEGDRGKGIVIPYSLLNKTQIKPQSMNCSILAQTNTFTFRLRALHRLRFHIYFHKPRLTKRLGVCIILFELQSFFVSISSDSCTHQQLSFLIAVRSDCLDLAITISSVSLAMVTTLLCHCTNTDRH